MLRWQGGSVYFADIEQLASLDQTTRVIPTMDIPPTDEDRTTAIGLARYAYDYLQAAIVVETNDPTPDAISPVPAYFLALHGIELTLKAFLRHKGVSVKDLQKKFGHDLHACHRKAKELGLHEVFKELPVDSDAMRMLVGLNEQQGLRYIKTGIKHFPLWSIVEPLAVRLHQAVAPLVGFKSFDKSYQSYLVAKPSAATLTAVK